LKATAGYFTLLSPQDGSSYMAAAQPFAIIQILELTHVQARY
jgi:hypothetical protein